MIKTPKPLLIDLYQIVPYASITVCMYVILAPRYTSVYTPVCWFAGMPRHRPYPAPHLTSCQGGVSDGSFGQIDPAKRLSDRQGQNLGSMAPSIGR